MPQLPDRPDLDHLRHQARELRRAAAAGDVDAIRRVESVSPRVTLWAAQLALAREYGFLSWARLKAEAERRAASGTTFLVRSVASPDELVRAFDVAGAQMTPATTHEDAQRFGDLARRFADDRSLMHLVEGHGSILGAALAFRTSPTGITLRIIGLEAEYRGLGLGRLLMEAVEVEAMHLGVGGIGLGGVEAETRGFYARMGYQGRRSMMRKGLPLPGRFLERRLRTLPRPPFKVVL